MNPNDPFDNPQIPLPAVRFDIECVPQLHQEERIWVFYDAYGYATQPFALKDEAAKWLGFFTGRDSVVDIATREKLPADHPGLKELVNFGRFLDQHGILDTPSLRGKQQNMELDFERASVRQPTCQDASYPADPQQLSSWLDEVLNSVKTSSFPQPLKALFAPHIDLRIGLDIYIQAFNHLKNSAPKRVAVIATSHYSGAYPEVYSNKPFVLTTKDFHVGSRTLSNAKKDTANLASHLGDWATLHDRAHRIEHSIELHLIWAQHIWKHKFEIIPILVGSFDDLLYSDSPKLEQGIAQCSDWLNSFMKQEDTFVLISGDLGHVGQKFGDKNPAHEMFEQIADFDKSFLQFAESRNPAQLKDLMKSNGDAFRMCGFPPLYSFLNAIKQDDKWTAKIIGRALWDERERLSAVSYGSVAFFRKINLS